MNKPIVIIGMGQLAGVLATAFLRNGRPVFPIIRKMKMSEEVNAVPDPEMVIVAVAKKDLKAVMEDIPEQWRDKLVLIQNELLPGDWTTFDITDPTILSVWFEKKKGMDYNPVLPSPVFGPHADLIAESLQAIEIPCRVVGSMDDMISELVAKNVFVITINICGLALPEGTTTSMLWEKDRDLAAAVADNVIDIQEHITGRKYDRSQLMEGLEKGLYGDPAHKCKGRSAQGRLDRILEIADKTGLRIKSIRELAVGG
ncbi:MAG: hypothetical protein PQJ58_04805 [Spirochaetales bacterium]|nr:hypothetical protein [Spirochaetales bacterium]